jgi:nitroimidazol reductase NimA-like FMN-containing flavoprotein (pyridoxamine 5'-phosphate oxidase superfamily)
MVGQLSPDEIEGLLRRQRVGRIAYVIDDQPYIVPVDYAYDGTAVYVASGAGQKIAAMRTRPRVCFEIDDIDQSAIWRSVVATGMYEELTCECERRAALARIGPEWETRIPEGWDVPDDIVVFRIHLLEKSGRFGREE